MLTAYNNDTSRVITGSSTHNERIERLWRDVHRRVTSNFNVERETPTILLILVQL